MTTRRAVIDIGTNSVKILVADVSEGQVNPVLEDSEQTRLGRGFYETQILQPGVVRHTAEAVATFAAKAKELGSNTIRIIATSAARDAKNPGDLVRAIEGATRLRLEIISGEQEADWAFQGVITNPDLARYPLLILDVGGGSTEFILGEHGHQHFRQSFNLGTVRLLEQLPHSDPPTAEELDNCRAWLRHFIGEKIVPTLQPALHSRSEKKIELVGTGGTSTIMARMHAGLNDYDRAKIEATRLSFQQVRAEVGRLWSLPYVKRQQIIGLPPKRADVILSGTVIFEVVMEVFQFPELRISTRGLRFAAVR